MDLSKINYSKFLLQSVRDKLRSIYNESSDRYDKLLYDQLMMEDCLLSRYIRRKNGHLESSVLFISSVLEWRKKNGISELHEKSFPSEFFELGGIYTYGNDKHGNIVLYLRLILFQKFNEIIDLLKKFIIYWLYKANDKAYSQSKGWILLFDCTDAGLINTDIEMTSFINSTLRNYFPYGQAYILVVNLSWLLNALKNVIIGMIAGHVRNRIKFCSTHNITSFISLDNLPDYLGGQAVATDYRLYPKDNLTTSEMVEKGLIIIKPGELDKINKSYEKVREFLKIK